MWNYVDVTLRHREISNGLLAKRFAMHDDRARLPNEQPCAPLRHGAKHGVARMIMNVMDGGHDGHAPQKWQQCVQPDILFAQDVNDVGPALMDRSKQPQEKKWVSQAAV